MTPAERAAQQAARQVTRERERAVFATVERVGQEARARDTQKQAMTPAERDASRPTTKAQSA